MRLAADTRQSFNVYYFRAVLRDAAAAIRRTYKIEINSTRSTGTTIVINVNQSTI